MDLPQGVWDYVVSGLAATPATLAALLGDRPDTDPIWDLRPAPDRFTLREVVAHLADWEPIWAGRIARTVAEDRPELPGYDEGEMAIRNGYASLAPSASLDRFRAGREAFVGQLRALRPDDWARVGIRQGAGPTVVLGQVALTLSHDAYHLRQVAEWLRAG